MKPDRLRRVVWLLAPAILLAGCAMMSATSENSDSSTGASQADRAGAGGAQGPGSRPSPKDFVAMPTNLPDIHFAFDRYEIMPEAARTLEASADWMKTNRNAQMLIEGHADERGTNEYNLALGDRRARAAMNYLVSRGVQKNRITTITYGEERPMCTAHSEECWAQNRRAHFAIKGR